jgi:hypothetical protein
MWLSNIWKTSITNGILRLVYSYTWDISVMDYWWSVCVFILYMLACVQNNDEMNVPTGNTYVIWPDKLEFFEEVFVV